MGKHMQPHRWWDVRGAASSFCFSSVRGVMS